MYDSDNVNFSYNNKRRKNIYNIFKEKNDKRVWCFLLRQTASKDRCISQSSPKKQSQEESVCVLCVCVYVQKRLISNKVFYLFILRARKHARMSGEGAEIERKRKYQVGSTLSTEPNDAGLDPMNHHEIMTWAEINSQTLNRLSCPGALEEIYFL